MDATKRRHPPSGAHPTRRKVVEEPFDPAVPPPASAVVPHSNLLGAIVEKGFSAATPSSAPRPTVLPFPVARHRSHCPYWGPAARDAGKDAGEEEEDEMDYQQEAAAAAGPLRRKEKKGMDFSQWQEFVNDTPPKRRQGRPVLAKKQSAQEVGPGTVTSKVGAVAAGERELDGGGMQLDSANARQGSDAVGLVSDGSSKKPMKQAELGNDFVKAGDVRDATLQGDDMELDCGESSIEAEINEENMARLAGISAGEIAEAQAEIVNRIDPRFVEMLRRRGREKSGVRGKGQQNSGPRKASRATSGDWLTAGEHSGHSWKAWSDRVERIRSCRFTLDGDILGFQTFQEQQDVHDLILLSRATRHTTLFIQFLM